MTPKNKRAIVSATIAGSLMGAYSKEDRTRLHDEIRLKLRKGINKSIKKYGAPAIDAIETGDRIWREAMDKFMSLPVEASYFVVALSLKDNKILSKHYGLSDGSIEKWAKPLRTSDARKIEQNTSMVCNFIFNRLNEEFGIVEEKRSVLARIKECA